MHIYLIVQSIAYDTMKSKTNSHMKFNFPEFLKQNGFTQTRNSDKRDIFEKKYYDPFRVEEYNARLTISYDGGYTEWNTVSIPQLTIELTKNYDSPQPAEHILYSGISPSNFDLALDLLSHTLPDKEFLTKYDDEHHPL